jgi:HKD family nuclease
MANKIIGIEEDFELLNSLRDARSVTLVMAFAKMSGWNTIKEPLLTGDAQVNIIVGLNFAITEPAVLTEWLRLKANDPYRFSIEVAPTDPVFHPKVMLVERPGGGRFAIIGSGNLTGGGLITNVECGVFIEKKARLDELAVWCVELAREPLSAEIIEEYKKIHAAFARAIRQSRRAEARLKRLLGHSRIEIGARPLPAWDIAGFLRDMDEYLATHEGAEGLKNRINGAREIRTALDMPNFKFDKAGWESFYGIVEFGRIALY